MSSEERAEICNEEEMLDQCGDWAFFVELVADFLGEQENYISAMEEAIKEDDFKKYYERAHAIKGAALNLRLTALAAVAKEAELIGKDLHKMKEEGKAQGDSYNTKRTSLGPFVHDLVTEFGRLKTYKEERADHMAEAEAGGDS